MNPPIPQRSQIQQASEPYSNSDRHPKAEPVPRQVYVGPIARQPRSKPLKQRKQQLARKQRALDRAAEAERQQRRAMEQLRERFGAGT